MTGEKIILPQARSAHEGELDAWFLCSYASPTFSRRFLDNLERADHFYAWQFGDELRIALARFQIDQLACESCTDDSSFTVLPYLLSPN